MSAFYLDSSALLKLYVAEKGSPWIKGLFDPNQNHRLFIARLTHVELASALARRAREGTLTVADQTAALSLFLYHLTKRLRVVEITGAVCARAAVLANTRALRAYDSVQLACAIESHQGLLSVGATGLTFVGADIRLLKAAQDEGLPADNPEDH